MFNQLHNRHSYDLFVLLGDNCDLLDEDSLQAITDYLWSEDCIDIGAVYSDILITDKMGPVCVKNNPAYSSHLVNERIAMNIPFVCKKAILPHFNEELKKLYLWDGMLWLMKHTLLYHIPKPLFQLKDGMDQRDVRAEVKIINETHYNNSG